LIQGGTAVYITEKYWEEYMGGTDDTLTLLEYLAEKGKEEVPLGEILSDFGVDKLDGDFISSTKPLVRTSSEGWEMEIHSATDFLTDLAALLLECKMSGGLDTEELEIETELPVVRITATPAEHEAVNRALEKFIAAPLSCDLIDVVSEEELLEMAAICKELRKELYE